MTFFLRFYNYKKGVKQYIASKRLILFLILIILVICGWNYYNSGILSPTIIEQYRDQYPVGAVLFFMFIYSLSVIVGIPSAPLNLAAGFFGGEG